MVPEPGRGRKGEGWGIARLDRALAYFAGVKRPVLPKTREEVLARIKAEAGDEEEE